MAQDPGLFDIDEFLRRTPARTGGAAATATAPAAPGRAFRLGRGAGTFLRRFGAPGILLSQGFGAADELAAPRPAGETAIGTTLRVLSGLDISGLGSRIGNLITGRGFTPRTTTPRATPQPESTLSPSEEASRQRFIETGVAPSGPGARPTRVGLAAGFPAEATRVSGGVPGGGFGVVPGVSATDRARALSAALRDRQFNLARGIANTPELLRQVEQAEETFDAREAVQNAVDSGSMRRLRGARQRLANLEARATAREAAGSQLQQALLEAAISARSPAARRQGAEAEAIETRLSAAERARASGASPDEVAAISAGRPLPGPTFAGTPTLTGEIDVLQTRGRGAGAVRRVRPRQAVEDRNIRATMRAQNMTRAQAIEAYRQAGYDVSEIE